MTTLSKYSGNMIGKTEQQTRQFSVLKVFLASPADVGEEANRLKTVIDELNRNFGGHFRYHDFASNLERDPSGVKHGRSAGVH